MRTIFVLSRADLQALKVGESFEIALANGVTILLQAEGRRPKPVISPKPKTKRTFSPKQKSQILKDAERGVSQAARKHQLSRSVIDRWKRERAAA